MIYSRGKYKGIDDEVIEGYIISTPINLPNTNYIWNQFYVDYTTFDGEIDFFILDKWKNIPL